ncbi:MAG: FAD-dependent oxidoreductase [Acidimicrobiia bacterium]|nr:MAG: FAD-dependent oxidoreductase [Acidimicrobiia bacterium]
MEHPRERTWDVVVVGAGHNGLTCAAYLAGAGLAVVVLERRGVVGGAASLEEPWPGFRVSPCAYLAGLLHPRVVEDLRLHRHGFEVRLLDPQMFVPIDDGISLVEWRDLDRTLADLARWAPGQVSGYRALAGFWDGIREALRPGDDRDLWLMEAPPRELVEQRLGGDPAAIAAVFEESVVDDLSRFLDDPRLIDGLASQGVIGTNAPPTHPGTAYIRFHHMCGRLAGGSGDWGFVEGGIGMVSIALEAAAREAGAAVFTGSEVVSISPGRGVMLADGSWVRARAVVSNADPKRTLGLLDDTPPADFAARVEQWPTDGCSAKVNVALSDLPVFNGDPISTRSQVDVGPGVEGMVSGHAAAREGRLGRPWAELYLQTAYDPSVAPPGRHVLSAFVQYVPYAWQQGSWDDHRETVAQAVFDEIERWSPGFRDLIEAYEVSGPPDIEAKIGLTGGHIFQGECLPPYMWDRRMPYRTPIDGLYLCGAATHPGGSVIAVNGRNSAMRILRDLGETPGD